MRCSSTTRPSRRRCLRERAATSRTCSRRDPGRRGFGRRSADTERTEVCGFTRRRSARAAHRSCTRGSGVAGRTDVGRLARCLAPQFWRNAEIHGVHIVKPQLFARRSDVARACADARAAVVRVQADLGLAAASGWVAARARGARAGVVDLIVVDGPLGELGRAGFFALDPDANAGLERSRALGHAQFSVCTAKRSRLFVESATRHDRVPAGFGQRDGGNLIFLSCALLSPKESTCGVCSSGIRHGTRTAHRSVLRRPR